MLTRAVTFVGAMRTAGRVVLHLGCGWSRHGRGFATVTQVQALRAAKNAGIVVPKSIIDKAIKYLENSTTESGGAIYSLAQAGGRAIGGGQPALTAAALACGQSAGEYSAPLTKRWSSSARYTFRSPTSSRFGHDEYTHYYFAQCLYSLGDDGYGKLFPLTAEGERPVWSKYRKAMFEHLLKLQSSDGSWNGGYVGPVYATAAYLTILQLDNGTLPIYQR